MNGSTERFLPSRLAFFFLAAILLPSGLLVLLTLRMVVQEQELTEKRAADERLRLASEVRQELLARVEQLRLAAAAAAEPGSRRTPPDEVALRASVQSGHLVLPWDGGGEAVASMLDEPAFRDAVATGERFEFVTGSPAEAAGAYALAARLARAPVQRATADLLLARAFTKARRPSDAVRVYRRLLTVPAAVTDDQGVPFAIYGARGLAALQSPTPDDAALALDIIRQTIAVPTSPPSAVYMAGDLLSPLQSALDGGLRDRAEAVDALRARRVRDVEQALALQRSFATLGAAASDPSGPVWVTFGPPDGAWLVNVAVSDPPVVTAVRAAPVLASLQTPRRVPMTDGVVVSAAAGGESLAPAFPGLTVALSAQAAAALAGEDRVPRAFYPMALALVVSVALFGGYLFWRDVRREVRLAEMRSQFVSSVSHELKTPLTAIRMFAETLLLGRARPGVSEEYLETIVNESERLTRLLNNVLDFSKIEQGKKTYRLEAQSLPAVVRAAVKAMQYPATQQGFDLRVCVDDGLPLVKADADAIEQAVLNLLSNAMKYSGDSRVVELGLRRDGSSAVLSVTDHGIGIPAAEQGRVFEKFYRVRDAATERVPGTGLGLALVDHVARAHGGRVEVTSAPGHGSTFALVLPLLGEHTQELAPTKALAT